MTELWLVRSRRDRNLFELDGVGSMQTGGWFTGDRATIEAGGVTWVCDTVGFWGGALAATDEAGSIEGRFKPTMFSGGGTLTWGDSEYALHATGFFTARYWLLHGDAVLWEFRPRNGGAKPVQATRSIAGLPDGAVMFAVYVARTLARRKSRQASAGSSGGVEGGGASGGGGGD